MHWQWEAGHKLRPIWQKWGPRGERTWMELVVMVAVEARARREARREGAEAMAPRARAGRAIY